MTDPLIARLPQEPPFRFLDRVVRHDPPREAEAETTFPQGDPIFAGHLPGDPIVPGVIIIEALAQLSGLVLLAPRGSDGGEGASGGGRVRGYLAGVSRLRFFRRVGPGETLRLRSALDRQLGSAAQFAVSARVGDERVAEGTITVGGIGAGDATP